MLGFWTCTALVVGNTIGVGIFLLPASLAPFGLNALTAWIITIVGCGFLAIVFSGLARPFPRMTDLTPIRKRAFGDGFAFLVLWCYWFSTWVTNATIAIGVVGYLSIVFPGLAVRLPGCHPSWRLRCCGCLCDQLLGIRAAGLDADDYDGAEAAAVARNHPAGPCGCCSTASGAYTAHVPPNPASLARSCRPHRPLLCSPCSASSAP